MITVVGRLYARETGAREIGSTHIRLDSGCLLSNMFSGAQKTYDPDISRLLEQAADVFIKGFPKELAKLEEKNNP